MSKVFYAPGDRYAWDEVIEVNGQEIGKWCGKSLKDAQQEKPGLVCVDREEAVRQIIQLVIRAPQEIDAGVFKEMLDLLPPCAWVRTGGAESFHMSEFDAFDITSIYVRIGSRYFMLKDTYKLSHDERIARIRQAFPDA